LETFEKTNKNSAMKRATTIGYFWNERCQIVARVNVKTIYTVRHVYLTTMTVLLMLQTQRFILTVSPPADL